MLRKVVVQIHGSPAGFVLTGGGVGFCRPFRAWQIGPAGSIDPRSTKPAEDPIQHNFLLQFTVYLFPSARTGTPLTERALGHLIAKYARQAQLTGVSPHTLRHRFGYRMAQTVPLHRLAQIMGHDSLDTTLLYIKGSASDLQHEVEKIAWI